MKKLIIILLIFPCFILPQQCSKAVPNENNYGYNSSDNQDRTFGYCCPAHRFRTNAYNDYLYGSYMTGSTIGATGTNFDISRSSERYSGKRRNLYSKIGADQRNENSGIKTADPNAIPEAKALLAYLQSLTNQSNNRVIIGQNVRRTDNYASDMTSIYTSTGYYPAMIGVDYTRADWGDVNAANDSVISFCQNGKAVCMMSWLIDNPVSGGGASDKTNVDFVQLITPGYILNTKFNILLDSLAAGLLVLQNHGIPVMLKFMHEMNGDWLWWNNKISEEYTNVWKYAFNYLTKTKGVHNVLWVYCIYEAYPGWPALKYYPGNNYVDAVGIDFYDSQMNRKAIGYDSLLTFGKPIGLPECGFCGPSNDSVNCAIKHDATILAATIKNYMPDIVFVNFWHQSWRLMNNYNVKQLFEDPWILTKGKLNY